MKKIFKFMAAAVTVVGLASCSDDLGLEKAAQEARQNADMVLNMGLGEDFSTPTRTGYMEDGFANGRLAAGHWVFTEGDQVRVFQLNTQHYNTYKLDPATAKTNKGAFLKTADYQAALDGKQYAITDATILSGKKERKSVYAISPNPTGNQDGEPLLTMTLPASFDLDEAYFEEYGIAKLPAPLWGEVTPQAYDGDATGVDPTAQKLEGNLLALTSFLRIDARTLPEGTKAIVLTTHGSRTSHMPTIGDSEAEGFQLATGAQVRSALGYTDPEQALTREDFLRWYNYGTMDEGYFITGGASEPLSGTLSAVLKEIEADANGKPVCKDGSPLPALQYSDILVSSDTIRVNFENIPEWVGNGTYTQGFENGEILNDDKVIYIPIVAGTYKNLHVIAVTEDSPFSYQWIGEELTVYNDETFKVNTIKQFITKVQVDVDNCDDWQELSDMIYKYSLANPGRILNIDIPEDVIDQTSDDDHTLYIDNELTRNDVILNWPEGAELPDGQHLDVVEQSAEVEIDDPTDKKFFAWSNEVEWTASFAPGTYPDPGLAERYITMNFNEICGSPEEYVEFITPTSIVTLGTTTGFNNDYQPVIVLAASENKMLPASTLNDPALEPGVSGHDLVSSDKSVMMNRKNATVMVKNGINTLELNPKSVGDVYIYSGGFEQTEILGSYAIKTTNPVKTRISDALIKNISVVNGQFADGEYNKQRYVFTTGSTAIGIVEAIANEFSTYGTESALDEPLVPVPNKYRPKNFHIVAYWTGAALQGNYAITNYDKAYVYTAAQLASAGEESQAKYAIPSGVVTEMWLGASEFPWLGAQVDVADFEFNGMDVSLQNMTLDIEDGTFIDPHHCCTSCGDMRKINLTEDLGLFRSIINSSSAKVDSINLNDVLLITDEPINNIGAIAGKVWTPKATFEHNNVGEIKIDVNGEYIGGMVGQLAGADGAADQCELIMKDNGVRGINENKPDGYIRSDKAYVGGQIGQALVKTAAVDNSVVDLDMDITAGSSNIGSKRNPNLVSFAGGVFGNIEASDSIGISKADVDVEIQIKGDEKFIGGIGGNIESAGYSNIYDSEVNTPLIESANAGYVGGVAGLLEGNEDNEVIRNTVTVPTISATGDSNAGGVAGRYNNRKEEATDDFGANKVVAATTIYALKENAGGLIGFMQMVDDNCNLEVDSAVVTIGKLEAVEGFAGGEVGSQNSGNLKIGLKDSKTLADAAYNTEITIDELSGAYGLGGLVGMNNDSLVVYTNVKDATKSQWSKVNINVKDWSTTKDKQYYDANNETDHRAGSMSNVVGFLNDDLVVEETTGYLNVTDKLSSAKKKALFFPTHKNRLNTQSDQFAYYWGDTNGLVGWGHSGKYKINENGQLADQQNWYNLYLTDDGTANSVYDKRKSRFEP